MRHRFALLAPTLGMLLAWLPSDTAAAQTRPATIWYSEQVVLHSTIMDRDFLIQIARPHKPSTGKLPALYLLDGDELFGEVAAMEGSFGQFGDAGPAYVIGVADPAQDSATWLDRRAHDYLYVSPPPNAPAVRGPIEGAKFQRFLLEELRPYIEAHYPVDGRHAALAGHSLSGLFVAHLLLNKPAAFETYLIDSPSIWGEPGLLQQAAAFRSPTPVRALIGVGSKEEAQFPGGRMVTNAKALADSLRDHPSGVDAVYYEVPGENHGTGVPAFFSRALQFAFPAPTKP